MTRDSPPLSSPLPVAPRPPPQSATAWLHQAWAHYDLGELDQAIEAASRSHDLSSQDDERLEACAALCWLHLENSDTQRAEHAVRTALPLAARHAHLQWHAGILFLRKKDPALAAHHLACALELNPALDEAASALAWALHDLGRLAEASIWARRALSQRVTPQRQAQLGWLLLQQGHAQDAVPLLQAALPAATHDVSTYLHLGRALAETGATSAALDTLDQGLARFPSHPDLLLAAGWLHHAHHEPVRALDLAQQVVCINPLSGSAWHLQGAALHALQRVGAAEHCLSQALTLDGTNADAAATLATLFCSDNQWDSAQSVLSRALLHSPNHPALRLLQAEVALQRSDSTLARNLVGGLLAESPQSGHLWYLLARCLLQLNHARAARGALQRAIRYAPHHTDAMGLRAWLALEDRRLGDAQAANAQLLAMDPYSAHANTQAAFILAECNDLAQAGLHAERAIAADHQSAEAWRAMGTVRLRQGQPHAAQDCFRTALALLPEPPTQCLRALGRAQLAAGQLPLATATFQQALDGEPESPVGWLELAQAQLLQGNVPDAAKTVEGALRIRPAWPDAELLQARIYAAGTASQQRAAVDHCRGLLRRRVAVPEATHLLLELAALGCHEARQAFLTVSREGRLQACHAALEHAQGHFGHTQFCQMVEWAQQDFPHDVRIATMALCSLGLRHGVSPQALARRTRSWGRRLCLNGSPQAAAPATPHLPTGQRLRIAYVAAHFHRSLLLGVLATHDHAKVDIFLYCDISADSLGELAQVIHLQPLHGRDLVASMHANRIDVAIDTVGVGGVLGQDRVLQQFARRVAPVQCAWLGSWAGGGGVYDCLLTDAHALPESHEPQYEESIIRLAGGQWAWTPPVLAPPVAPPPSLARERIRLGCPVRAFRISPRTMQTWARLLARLPQADLVLMGRHTGHAPWRAELLATLVQAGLDPSRVSFQAQRPYLDYLAGYADMDIVLDSFPANGGLCLLDALWMGVPVVSLAGQWLGERQGLSILAAIGHPEWVAFDEESYIRTVCALANNARTLAPMRERLRSEITASPLVNAQRIARAIETTGQLLKQRALDVAQAASHKERARALARHQLATWLGQPRRLSLQSSAQQNPGTPDVSVVIVLFNQAGLSRQAFSALADQTEVTFETIVVDNASSDSTPQLLDRLDGVTVIRNATNVGFLHAANQGARVAQGRHIVFLNNDAILHPHALRQGVRRLDGCATIGAVGGRIVLADGSLQEAGCTAYRTGSTAGYGRGKDPHAAAFCFVRDVDFCSGAFLMVRKDLWQRLGGFDPAYAPAYYEDTDLCLRIQDAGFRVVYDPSIWLTHFEWASSTSGVDAVALMEGRQALFAQRHQARLAQRPPPEDAQPDKDRWLAQPHTRRILLIDNAVPHMAVGGGLPRARLVVHALADQHLTLFPLWDFDDDWSAVYASIPETVEVMLGVGASGLERFLEQRAGVYDYVMVSRPPNMAFVKQLWDRRPELFAGMRLVYDAEAIFALREIGKAAVQGQPLPLEMARQLVDEELALVHRAESVLTVSAIETAVFQAAGARQVYLLSHAMETRSHAPDWSHRSGLLFVGAIHPHTPNEDSLLWFLEHIVPVLRGLEADFPHISIVGDCTSDKVARLATGPVRLVGRVDDLTPWYDRHRVFIAPTRFAAGVPAKVIEAACNGIPVVATPLLVRQLGWEDGIDIASGADAAAFALAVAALYNDSQTWTRMCHAMAGRTRAQYATASFASTLRAAFGLMKE